MSEHYVGLFGANGHTGRFIAHELQRRGLRARWIGRDADALSALRETLGHGDVRCASVEDLQSLRHAFEGLDAVINCAGPFLDTATPVTAAALAAGCHVLDVTAEQATVLDTIARFDDAAKMSGRIVMPAMAFYGGLADLLATSVMADWSDADAIEIAIALNSWQPTKGTRVTGERNTAARLIVRDSQLTVMPSPPPSTTWEFPEPFGRQAVTCVPLSEVITLSRHVKASAITSYMNLKPLSDLADNATPPPKSTDALGRSDQLFVMAVRVTRGEDLREGMVTGQDIYAVTAPLVVEACTRIVSGAGRAMAGVRAPSEIFDADDFLAALAPSLKIERSTSIQATRFRQETASAL